MLKKTSKKIYHNLNFKNFTSKCLEKDGEIIINQIYPSKI
jgi:hypothetical protein